MRQAQKMEVLGQLTGGIAHDFNNLLAAMMGSLEIIERRVGHERPKEALPYIDAAQDAVTRAAALTQRLLAFSRRHPPAPRPSDVNDLVAGLEDLIRRTMGPGIRVRVAAQPGLWPIVVDPHQLENAILNLCINARDAMSGGGRLTIETANVEAAAAADEGASGDHVVVRVGDTGSGMAPEILARAFEPFFTTKPVGQGTGLGLSMIQGFARQSGGAGDDPFGAGGGDDRLGLAAAPSWGSDLDPGVAGPPAGGRRGRGDGASWWWTTRSPCAW